LADETWKIANTPATRFQIGSLTKQFTAALILELAQQGRLNLDAALSVYLPHQCALNANTGSA
jgi:CubicO group peptidase (beta-lactamase class C family)